MPNLHEEPNVFFLLMRDLFFFSLYYIGQMVFLPAVAEPHPITMRLLICDKQDSVIHRHICIVERHGA